MINTFEKYSAVMSEMSPGGGGGYSFFDVCLSYLDEGAPVKTLLCLSKFP